MSEFLNKLTPVRRGMSPAQVASPERIEALQEAVKALWEGRNVTGRGMRVNRGVSGLNLEPIVAVENRQGHRFTPLFAHDQLRVGLGTLGVGQINGTRVIEPYYPKWQDKRLNADDAPFLALSELTAGNYQIVVIFCYTDGRIEVLPKDEEVPHAVDEWVVQVATFTKLATGVENVEHLWRSDILICCADDSCSSVGSEGSGDSFDSSNDSGFSDSSDSSSGSGGGGGPEVCCPTLTVSAAVYSVGAGYLNDCFTFADTAENVEIGVVVNVIDNPCECRNAFIRVQVGAGKPEYRNLGFAGSGSVELMFNISAVACQDVPITACWMTSIGIAGGAGTPEACHGNVCCSSTVVRMPGVCGEGECSDDSGGSSSSGSEGGGGSGGSSGGSGSGDPGSEKTAIVRLSSSPTGLAKLFCMEGTESWFVTFMTVSLCGRGRELWVVPKDFREVCEENQIFVGGMQAEGGRRVAARFIESDTLELLVRDWVWPWQRTEVKIMLVGVRKGHDHGRLPPATEYEWSRNEWFLKLAR